MPPMHRTRFQTAGWGAFDDKHHEKQGNGAGCAADSCSTISDETYSGLMKSSKNAHSGESSLLIQSLPTMSFSSVVQPSMPVESPLLKAHTRRGTSNTIIDGNQHVVTVKDNANPVGMLKDGHSWADQHLIEDILTAVNNDVGQASFVLKEMISSETGLKSKHSGPFGICSSIRSNLSEDTDIVLEKSTSVDNILSDNSYKELIAKQLYVPTEPDWEEDDVYESHHKEALKITRAASQHSRGARNAYSRGDHVTAQQLSSRAREERMTAKQLNAQAAEEILRIRNEGNDMWKLDLHGLHATEAVHVLKQHLQRIESKMMTNRSSPSNELAKIDKIQPSSSFVSLNGLEISTNAKGIVVPQKRQTLLQVITGIGNNSKGHASLPAAIRSFLNDGGYRFDDARPGVISVQPIFRYK